MKVNRNEAADEPSWSVYNPVQRGKSKTGNDNARGADDTENSNGDFPHSCHYALHPA
jgi:hypothetical protein